MSNELKATPGPWRVSNYDSSACDDSLIVDSEGEEVLGVSEWARVDDEDLDLIAAAPELYEACKKMRDYMAWQYGDEDPHVLEADSALAKARGES